MKTVGHGTISQDFARRRGRRRGRRRSGPVRIHDGDCCRALPSRGEMSGPRIVVRRVGLTRDVGERQLLLPVRRDGSTVGTRVRRTVVLTLVVGEVVRRRGRSVRVLPSVVVR